MFVCRSCGSSRIRSGYQPPPLLLRLLFVRTILCDHCNAQYRAFSVLLPDTGRERQRSHPGTVSFSPAQSGVDLNRLNQPFPMTVNPTDERKKRSLDYSTTTGNSKSDKVARGYMFSEITEEKLSSESDMTEETNTVALRQKSRPPCPRCRSVHTRRRHRNTLERLFLSFSVDRPFACEACGKRFYGQQQLSESDLDSDDR
jgi:hypothetical protein